MRIASECIGDRSADGGSSGGDCGFVLCGSFVLRPRFAAACLSAKRHAIYLAEPSNPPDRNRGSAACISSRLVGDCPVAEVAEVADNVLQPWQPSLRFGVAGLQHPIRVQPCNLRTRARLDQPNPSISAAHSVFLQEALIGASEGKVAELLFLGSREALGLAFVHPAGFLDASQASV